MTTPINKNLQEIAKALKYANDNSFNSLVMILIGKAQSTPLNLKALIIAFPEHVKLYNEWRETGDPEDFFKKYGI